MATARDYFRHAERALSAVHEDSEASVALLLEAAVNALLALGMTLGAHLPPLDPAAMVADLSLPANDEGPADATAEPSA